MLVHPLLNPSTDGRPLTDAVITLPTPTTLRPIEEILRQSLTIVLRRVRRAEELAPIVAALVVLRPHKRLTLFIPRRALSARAGEALAGGTTARAFIRVRVRWTRRRGSRACFLRIAGAG